ncbi:MAG: NAD(P)/FAD-dependent oxidoreductase [Oscillospiraceae bacterium]|nr:NAD(P)/FAD-dependent oxidoreductase [Oscillospiraceae bacterium]
MVEAFETFPHLLKPLKIGNILFRNRMFCAPTGHTDIIYDGQPSIDAIMYYERKAMGGAATVTSGEVAVDPDEFFPGRWPCEITMPSNHNFARLATAISGHGAVPVVELAFTGFRSRTRGAKRDDPPWGPIDTVLHDGQRVVAMTDERIFEVIKGFGKAALAAKKAGFGMVCMHAAHGWGLQQFMSPFTNTRTDEWGGNTERRCRFTVMAIDEIHRQCGRDFPVEVRISATEVIPNGYDIDEAVLIAKQLDGHADIIHVSVGGPDTDSAESFARTHVSMFYPQGRNVEYASEIKKHMNSSLVGAVGGLFDPYYMEQILASGKADIVHIARGLICDPDLPNKVRQGRPEDIRKCMRCLNCYSEIINHGDFFCALNPEVSREREVYYSLPAPMKKRVLVIGGGIAGMQAALTAARGGHEVVLCERGAELGGRILCEREVPFKKNLHDYILQQGALLSKAGVDVRLNTDVTYDYALQESPDVIIAAIGSEPVVPDLPGIDGQNVHQAVDVFANPSLAKGKTMILGGGFVGTELAIYLKSCFGIDVEIVEMGGEISDGGNDHHMWTIEDMLEQHEIPLHFHTKAVRIDDAGVVCEGPGGTSPGGEVGSGNDRGVSDGADARGSEVVFRADTVIYAVGMRPLWDDALVFEKCAGAFHMVGECRKAANILFATSSAFVAARHIGRH